MSDIEVLCLLSQYKVAIEGVRHLFSQQFAGANAVRDWRRLHLARVGYLASDHTIEYALHGAGCTVEFAQGTLVSFDVDERGNYLFDVWKFKLYAESVGLPCDGLADQYVKGLAQRVF